MQRSIFCLSQAKNEILRSSFTRVISGFKIFFFHLTWTKSERFSHIKLFLGELLAYYYSYPNKDLILALTALMSARPCNCGFRMAITLPISCIPAAADSPMALRTSASISESLS